MVTEPTAEYTPTVAVVRPMFELLEDDYSMEDAAKWPEPFADHDLSTEECAVTIDVLEHITQTRVAIQRRNYLETIDENQGSAKATTRRMG